MWTFDGVNKLIIGDLGTTSFDVKAVYSDWKEWVATDENTKYLQAFSVLGGDPTVSGQYLGSTFFLENDWKVRPQEANHTLNVNGNMYSRDGSAAFVPTLGTYQVLIIHQVSNLVDTLATDGSQYTPEQIADEVMDRDVLTESNFLALK